MSVAAIELMLTMLPPPAAFIARASARMQRKMPATLVSSIASISAAVELSTLPAAGMPAELTARRSGPSRSTGRGDGGVDRGVAGDVADDPVGVGADLGRGVAQHVLAPPGQHHLAAARGDGAGTGKADAGAAAGDESNLSVESAHNKIQTSFFFHHRDTEARRFPACSDVSVPLCLRGGKLY